MHHIIGKLPKEEEKFLKQLSSMKNEEIQEILDDIQFAISQRGSNNMVKIAYLYGIQAVEAVGTNYLDLHLQGLTRSVQMNEEIEFILKELSCIYGINSWIRPEAKLAASQVSGVNGIQYIKC